MCHFFLIQGEFLVWLSNFTGFPRAKRKGDAFGMDQHQHACHKCNVDPPQKSLAPHTQALWKGIQNSDIWHVQDRPLAQKNVDGTNIQKIKGWRTVFGFPFEGFALKGSHASFVGHGYATLPMSNLYLLTIIPPSSTSLVMRCNERPLVFSHREKIAISNPTGGA